MTPLLELADRVEAATGADRGLDAEIEVTVAGFPEQAYAQRNAMRPKGTPELDRMAWLKGWGVLAFTASLDAAMTLVPEGHEIVIGNDQQFCYAAVAPRGTPDSAAYTGNTMVLALCSAALRARASHTTT